MQKKYRISYLPIFEVDLHGIIDYISLHLRNPKAAQDFLDALEKAIENRMKAPLSFEKYKPKSYHKDTYYRIYVKNYIVYYVVKEDLIEVRRLLYNQRIIDKHL
jgi:toxin ParE1/3/4